jgi:hypothetical protein
MKYSETKGYKYILREVKRTEIPGIPDERAWNNYISLDHGTLILKENYAWDGSSIPLKKYFKWIWDSDKYCKTASLVHDAFCQLMREDLLDKKYKRYVDGFYKYMCMLGGMGKRQANLRYWFLRKFGDKGIQKRKNPRGQIKIA